jgi:hypothetical protein
MGSPCPVALFDTWQTLSMKWNPRETDDDVCRLSAGAR